MGRPRLHSSCLPPTSCRCSTTQNPRRWIKSYRRSKTNFSHAATISLTNASVSRSSTASTRTGATCPRVGILLEVLYLRENYCFSFRLSLCVQWQQGAEWEAVVGEPSWAVSAQHLLRVHLSRHRESNRSHPLRVLRRRGILFVSSLFPWRLSYGGVRARTIKSALRGLASFQLR